LEYPLFSLDFEQIGGFTTFVRDRLTGVLRSAFPTWR
jgi:hypothetical protein